MIKTLTTSAAFTGRAAAATTRTVAFSRIASLLFILLQRGLLRVSSLRA